MYIMISTVYICTALSTKETFLCSLSVLLIFSAETGLGRFI